MFEEADDSGSIKQVGRVLDHAMQTIRFLKREKAEVEF